MNGTQCAPTPILKYLIVKTIDIWCIQTFYQNSLSNVDRVYDLTVVHPGVEQQIAHTLPKGDWAKHILVNTERPV